MQVKIKKNYPYQNCRPYTRWWWFADIIKHEDIKDQLDWLKENNFGGVEIAFIYPVDRDPDAERIEWLGKEWREAVECAKNYADGIGLGCDFTFGSLWPFGGTFVADADRTQVWNKPDFKQPHHLSWEHPKIGNVLNHLDRHAFERYAKVMGDALSGALKDFKSAIFCDSWEVETKHIWTEGFDKIFEEKFGYDIKPFMDKIYCTENKHQLYDYMKLTAELVLNEFYIPFDQKAHELGAISRVQCHGSPTDLITAYANCDVPETEAMLFEPEFSMIGASAAALSGKKVVSSETFTCLYGWPAKYFKKEQTADLKLCCDALFASGVNQIFWHGMPYNPKGRDNQNFYATVHVGKTGSLSGELKQFNTYMTKVSAAMRFGRTYSDIAVYLPLEDAWTAGEYPKELQMPWAWGAYELRYEKFNSELKGYHPLWINNEFLSKGIVRNKKLFVNDLEFGLLYIEAAYLDIETLGIVLRLASEGLPVCLKDNPEQAGSIKSKDFNTMTAELLSLPNVKNDLKQLKCPPALVQGEDLPLFWCRTDGKTAKIFFANPIAGRIKYPVLYGQSFQASSEFRNVRINFNGKNIPVVLEFKPYQSLLLNVNETGEIEFEDIYFKPKTPELNATFAVKVNTLNAFIRSEGGGNPAGVVLSADFITDEEMLRIAKKVGFSETAFVLKTDKADLRLRYFTPAGEVPLCGHATVASFGLLAMKGSLAAGKYKLETKAGILNIEILPDKKILMDQNLPEFFETIDKNEIAESLKIPVEAICPELPVQVVSTGLKDIIVPIRSLKELLSIDPDFDEIKEVSRRCQGAGYHVFTTETMHGSTAHCRNFAPLYDIPEESATGTASGALACYMFKYGIINEKQSENIVFEQGYSMNRPSEIFASLQINDGKISGVKVGGRTGEISEMQIEI